MVSLPFIIQLLPASGGVGCVLCSVQGPVFLSWMIQASEVWKAKEEACRGTVPSSLARDYVRDVAVIATPYSLGRGCSCGSHPCLLPCLPCYDAHSCPGAGRRGVEPSWRTCVSVCLPLFHQLAVWRGKSLCLCLLTKGGGIQWEFIHFENWDTICHFIQPEYHKWESGAWMIQTVILLQRRFLQAWDGQAQFHKTHCLQEKGTTRDLFFWAAVFCFTTVQCCLLLMSVFPMKLINISIPGDAAINVHLPFCLHLIVVIPLWPSLILLLCKHIVYNDTWIITILLYCHYILYICIYACIDVHT